MRHGRLSAAIVPAALACFGAGAALAACPSDEAIDAFVADWKASTPTKAIAVDLRAIQKFNVALADREELVVERDDLKAVEVA
jgi:hypothetical protein